MNINSECLTCPHCGREWSPDRSNVGAITAVLNRHTAVCATRTPARRRKGNRRVELDWKKRPRRCPVRNNPDHPGLRDE